MYWLWDMADQRTGPRESGYILLTNFVIDIRAKI